MFREPGRRLHWRFWDYFTKKISNDEYLTKRPTNMLSSISLRGGRRIIAVIREYSRRKYHCTIVLLFDWFGISCMTTDNFCLYLQNRLVQTSQTGGQWYSDTSSFSVPCSYYNFYANFQQLSQRFSIFKITFSLYWKISGLPYKQILTIVSDDRKWRS